MRCLPGRGCVADRGNQRPGPARRDERRAEPADPARLDASGGSRSLDPASTWVHASVDLGTDVTLLPGTSLEGATSVGAGATIGPDTTLVDVEVGENATVDPYPWLVERDRVRRERRPVRVPAARDHARCGRQDRHLRGDQERPARGRRQGATPQLRRRRGDRRRRQHRGRRDLRQLRRRAQGRRARSAPTASWAATPCSPHRCTSPTAPTSRRVRRSPTTSESGELGVARGRQRNIPGWVARKRAGTKTARAAAAALDQRTVGEAPNQSQNVSPAPLAEQIELDQARPAAGEHNRDDRNQASERQASDAVLGAGLPRAGRRGRPS